ncbi:hypothetical protein [Burkholderia sp. LMG 21824]|uniref:hypothetical protein n=1 Tax=Burkholderia sp. LMG 21824 TaxID=3158172 RepID=UPI003C2D4CB2
MFEYRISVALDRGHTGRAVHLFTTEWMKRPEFDVACPHIVDNFLPMHGYRISVHKRDARMQIGALSDFEEL